MTLGRREYNEADMLRMQRDAEERVREMQNRARITVEQDNINMHGNMSRNRNWSNGTNPRRQNNNRFYPQGAQPQGIPAREAREQEQQPLQSEPEPAPETNGHHAYGHEEMREEKKKTTIVEDIMGALSLDEDYLLIIGLMLILLNQRADTTLILALAYLLI